MLKTSLAKFQKQQTRLEQELKEKESELEDLGCWRWLLAKVKLLLYTHHISAF